jgi:hypothetical protein
VNSGIISSSTAILDGTSLVNIAVLPAASGDGLLLPARVLIADRSSVSVSAPVPPPHNEFGRNGEAVREFIVWPTLRQ